MSKDSSVRPDGDINPTIAPGSTMPSTAQATIDAPEIGKNDRLDTSAKSVKTVDQAWNICKATETNNRMRASRTADIQNIYDYAPPRSASNNLEKAKSWQHNFSTGWLAGVVDRVVLRFIGAVNAQVYLTASRLPPSLVNWKSKTDILRAKTTRLFRSWSGFDELIDKIATENTLQGYAYAVFPDPETWKPVMMKQDMAYVPEKAGQRGDDLQFFVIKWDYEIEKFVELFKDIDIAEEQGYEIENCNIAASHAVMADPREDATTTEYRKLVDMLTDGVLGLAYTSSGARIVKTWILLNKEYDGQVSFWLIDRDTGSLLRYSFKLFKKMPNAVTVFTFTTGNGSIHSSKGLGRKLAALAVAIELQRNRLLDNAMMSGLMLLSVDPKDRNRMAPIIMSPFIYIPKGIDVSQMQFSANSQTYEQTDQLMNSWAEQNSGGYIEAQIDPEGQSTKTATEARIDYTRETATNDVSLRRFGSQMGPMISEMQMRAYADDNLAEGERLWNRIQKEPDLDTDELFEKTDDPDLYQTIVDLYRYGISQDEIRRWRKSPASLFANLDDQVIQQGIALVVAKYTGNANINQSELIKLDVESMVGPEVSEKLLNLQPDQTVIAEGVRQQLIESSSMLDSGIQMPVSERDPHLIHAATVQNLLTNVAAPVLSKSLNVPGNLLKATELNLNHMATHLEMAKPKDGKSDQFKQLEQFWKGFTEQFKQVIQIHADAAAAQQAAVAKIRAQGISQGGPAQPPPTPPAPVPPPVPAGNPVPVPVSQAPAGVAAPDSDLSI